MADVILKPRDQREEGILVMQLTYEQLPTSDFIGSWTARFKGKRYSVILTRDDISGGRAEPDPRWHLSIAADDKVPTWDAVAAIAHELRPGVPFALGVPPKSWWINVHPGTLHLWELRDQNLLDQWRAERRGDTPT